MRVSRQSLTRTSLLQLLPGCPLQQACSGRGRLVREFPPVGATRNTARPVPRIGSLCPAARCRGARIHTLQGGPMHATQPASTLPPVPALGP